MADNTERLKDALNEASVLIRRKYEQQATVLTELIRGLPDLQSIEFNKAVELYQSGNLVELEMTVKNLAALKGAEQFQTITKLPPDHPGISTAVPFDLLLNELRPLLPGVIKVDPVSAYLPNIDKYTVVREVNGAQVSTNVFVEKASAGMTLEKLARLIVETVNRADAETAS